MFQPNFIILFIYIISHVCLLIYHWTLMLLTSFNPLTKSTFSSNVLNLFKNHIVGLTQSSLSPAVAFGISITLHSISCI